MDQTESLLNGMERYLSEIRELRAERQAIAGDGAIALHDPEHIRLHYYDDTCPPGCVVSGQHHHESDYRAENERLNAEVRMWEDHDADHDTSDAALKAEIERLKKTLERIQEWDYINPPDPQSDGPWLKRLVDEALSS